MAEPSSSDCVDSETIVESLREVGKEALTLASETGQSLIVLPYGARILGLFSVESTGNFLWTHPALASAETARTFYSAQKWHNSGGDRTWLAPERDFFYPDFPITTRYVQPKQFDSARYQPEHLSNEVVLRTEFALRSYRTNVELNLSLSKTVRFVEDPLGQVQNPKRRSDLQFAGYRLTTSLVAEMPIEEDSCVGVWNLLQLPGGGDLYAPTFYRTEPTVFFGDIPVGHLCVEDRYVRYRMEAPGEQKICISALATEGRLGYLRKEGECYTLVVRRFNVDPAGAYCDVWPTRPEDNGYAVQACNINTCCLGNFAEMEYHSPAIDAGSPKHFIDDVSDVWAYRGDVDAVRDAALILLGIDIVA